MITEKFCLFTNDVETTSIWHNSLRDETGIKVYREGMPILLDLYAKYNIKSTFFFTAYIAKLVPDVVKMVLKYGHEVGSHGKLHDRCYGFDIMPLNMQKEHLEYSKKLLEDISGEEVISFRAPALRVSKLTSVALLETGFRIDSSVASQRFDFFLSSGSVNKIKWLLTPRCPYRVNYYNIFKRGDSQLVEVPISSFIIPYIGTTLRVLPRITMLIRGLLYLESKITDKPIVFLIHPNEFLDEKKDLRIIKKQSKNYIVSLLQDIIRSKIKVKNLGINAKKLYESELIFFLRKSCEFTTIKDYVNKYIK
ncbi:polysaccharide deacetylase family protein [Melioribacter sp. Ez-97]|uniref:polysaccharide deacetylase family protein n=1 Tax=Melioribacter sp. Ez-97 TaxID=3423434 RepID=UPI003ED85710